jgi:hypothetical protein
MASISSVDIYPLPEIYRQSDNFTVTINGKPVPVIAFLTEQDYDYAHFSFSGNISVTVEVTEPIRTFQISPLSFGLEGMVLGNRLTFQLEESRYLIIKINGYKELVLAADPPESFIPNPSESGIFHLVDRYHADPAGQRPSTVALQQAIDEASAAGGGTVYVPAGVFVIGNIILKSNVTLYLQGGAVLRATGRKQDYAVHFCKESLSMEGTWFITTEPDSVNIAIRGRGTIDGNGSYMRLAEGFLNSLIVPLGTASFLIEGIIGRDAGLWALIPTRSRHVSIRDYKGFQSLVHYEDDAMDVVECQHVVVEHAIAISEDDPYSTKTLGKATATGRNWPGAPQVLEDVLFEDVVAWTHCAAFKIGMGVEQTQRKVIFRNGYVYQASRAIAVHHRFGTALAEEITYENIDIEQVVHHRNGPYWLQLEIEDVGRGIGPVRNIVLRNIRVRDAGTKSCKLKGVETAAGRQILSGVTFDHIYMPEQTAPATTLEEMHIKDHGLYEGVTTLPTWRDPGKE